MFRLSVLVAEAPVRPVVLQVIVMPLVPNHGIFWPTPLTVQSSVFQSVQAFLSDSQDWMPCHVTSKSSTRPVRSPSGRYENSGCPNGSSFWNKTSTAKSARSRKTPETVKPVSDAPH